MTVIQWLAGWLTPDNTHLIYLLTIILIVSLLDFILGWLNAKFTQAVDFSAGTALWGIIKKIVYFMLLVLFIPIALLLPDLIALSALYILYTAYLLSELQSVLSHFNDDQTLLFKFIQKIAEEVSDEPGEYDRLR